MAQPTRTLNLHKITEHSMTDGPGPRTVVFLQGCPIRCPGCQNRHLWPKAGGMTADPLTIADQVLALDDPITVSGGEPFAQAEAVATMIFRIKDKDPDRHVVVYSGYTWQDLIKEYRTNPDDHRADAIRFILEWADVLVDGPYIADQDHDGMQYRGSANQRVIDLKQTDFAFDDPANDMKRITTIPDWDQPVITFDGDQAYGSAETMRAVYGADDAGLEPARRCGQTAPDPETDPTE